MLSERLVVSLRDAQAFFRRFVLFAVVAHAFSIKGRQITKITEAVQLSLFCRGRHLENCFSPYVRCYQRNKTPTGQRKISIAGSS